MNRIKSLLPDLFLILGIAAILYGCFSIYPPLGWLGTGIFLIWISFLITDAD